MAFQIHVSAINKRRIGCMQRSPSTFYEINREETHNQYCITEGIEKRFTFDLQCQLPSTWAFHESPPEQRNVDWKKCTNEKKPFLVRGDFRLWCYWHGATSIKLKWIIFSSFTTFMALAAYVFIKVGMQPERNEAWNSFGSLRRSRLSVVGKGGFLYHFMQWLKDKVFELCAIKFWRLFSKKKEVLLNNTFKLSGKVSFPTTQRRLWPVAKEEVEASPRTIIGGKIIQARVTVHMAFWEPRDSPPRQSTC